MALKLEKVNDRGAKTIYHRICSLAYDCGTKNTTITVRSYVSQNYREMEKEGEKSCDDRDAIINELNELVSDPTPANEGRRKELSDRLNSVSLVQGENTPKHLAEETYEFSQSSNIDAELSLSSAYEWLKENVYQKAEDC